MASGHSFPSMMLLTVTITALLIVLTGIVYFLYCLWRTKGGGVRTAPFESASPLNGLQRFSLKEIKSATRNFSASNSIGKGGSGAVYRGVLKDGKIVAVKVLDSLGDYEFQNEVKILGGLKRCSLVVPLLGFCVEEGKRLLVFDYMPNRSLQECLFLESDDVLSWSKRFAIIHDVVKALVFLHLECHPPVIHGDVKPSNVLLDSEFRARISDFGLSRLKLGVDLFSQDLGTRQQNAVSLEQTDEIDFAQALQISTSAKTNTMKKLNLGSCGDSKGKEVSGPVSESGGIWSISMPFDADLGSTGCSRDLKSMPLDTDLSSTDHSRDLNPNSGNQWGEDWWWKQDGSGELCSKEYVMEWIRSQIYPSSTPDWDVDRGVLIPENENPVQEQKPEAENRQEVKKHRKMVEWWKEEQLNDTPNKKATSHLRSSSKRPHFGLGKCFTINRVRRHENDNDNFKYSFRKECRGDKDKSSPSTIGDMFSHELSSTTSVRGTFCYAAPEYSEHNYLMETADIYSLGVLILVTVSGRRPLHVLSPPMKFKKANLISWAKSLAKSRNVLELVDARLGNEYNKEEASLCINLALYCLQKIPELRPGIGDVLRILNGERELLPPVCNFSPSSPLRFSQKRRRKQVNCLD